MKNHLPEGLQKEIQLPPITKEQLSEYAEASTDLNPIHIDDQKAREFGLLGVIAHGMLTMAFMSKIFTPVLERGGMVQDFHARFKAKVFEGDSLTVKAMPSETDDVQISVFNQHQDEVATGYANIKCLSKGGD
ncbi:MaoC/PaaZ C-terminal domain-containing protein [Salinibacillus xinjiangensis]|uniref:Dehydratase n=1 Tax=Salinibacillus xinjiangensis TaxID=1229268 RepID=A0A6G1X1Q2_9BACI|nr:MaoC/PaaZ C-terminal domain-containing protein [Salinibacillus xinjiangensis]MRG84913.1 dehydratase [Salinibacillus xinjiangensis]